MRRSYQKKSYHHKKTFVGVIFSSFIVSIRVRERERERERERDRERERERKSRFEGVMAQITNIHGETK